jgi:hypothetical protein
MSSERPQISILDARLAEIDDRLRTIQDGLTEESPAGERVSLAAGPPVTADQAQEVLGELRALAGSHERLLASMRELLRAYEQALAGGPGDPSGIGLTVGPLDSTEGLRAFEQAVAGLSAVEAVELRGYEGGDRAVLDVRLRQTP